MFLAKKILTALILPPTGPLLLALFGLWLMHAKSRRWRDGGRWLAIFSLTVLLALSTPIVSGLLPRERLEVAVSPQAIANSDAIVILGGGIYRDAPEYGGDTLAGSGLERVRYGARLAKLSGHPVLVTGGAPAGGRPEAEVMRDVLAEEYGIQARWVENRSRDTAENASLSAPMLQAQGVKRILLVSHAIHLPRAIPLFEREGLVVTPAPTIIGVRRDIDIHSFLPSAGALARSTNILYELLGSLFNQLTGKS